MSVEWDPPLMSREKYILSCRFAVLSLRQHFIPQHSTGQLEYCNIRLHNSFELLICSSIIVGKANSLLKPMQYIIIFSVFDIVSLAIQAAGGALASKAQIQGASTVAATHLMVPTIHFLLADHRKQG